MSDPSLAQCDHEPWNQQSDMQGTSTPRLSAKGRPYSGRHPKPKEIGDLSVYERVMRRVAIFAAPGVHAAFVYDVAGVSTRPEPCFDCADVGIVETWQEYEWHDGEKRYQPHRYFDLCEACGIALRALPIGQRWRRSKTRAAVLARCIRALEGVEHTAAVEALRMVQP